MSKPVPEVPAVETWMAAHDDCPDYGCGDCVIIPLDIEESVWRELVTAAKILREPLDVFLYRAIRVGLNARQNVNYNTEPFDA